MVLLPVRWNVYISVFGNMNIGWWYIPIFMFIISASAFSANRTDGLDGFARGVALFTFVALTVVAFALGRYDLATFSGVTVGALLAFYGLIFFRRDFLWAIQDQWRLVLQLA